MGDIYSDIDALSQHAKQVVAEQRSGVPSNYPVDYLYYPLKGEDGKPLITKVGDEYYSAWMKRSAEGEPFTDIVLLTQNQLDKIYASRPGAKPDIEGGRSKSFQSTGRQVYSNPDLDVEIPASSVSEVYYDVRSGRIVDEVTAIDANYEAYENRIDDENIPSMPYKKVLLPNDLLGDGYVSSSDLDHALHGYRKISEVIAVHSQDSANKAVAESFLGGAVNQANSYLIAAKGGNFAPQMAIDSFATVEGVQSITFEKGLQGKQNILAPSPDNNKAEEYYAKLKAQEAAILAKHNEAKRSRERAAEFNDKAAAIDHDKPTKLDKYLETLDKKLAADEPDSRINRVIANGILGYLNKIHHNETLFAVESSRAIAELRGRGLDKHADILAEYAQDPNKGEFKEAKKLLREVEKTTPNTDVQTGKNKRQIAVNGDAMPEERHAVMQAMQAALTPEFIDGSLRRLGVDTDSFSVQNYHHIMKDLYKVIEAVAMDKNGDIEDNFSPANIEGILQEQMRKTLEEINSSAPLSGKTIKGDEPNYDGGNHFTPPALN